MNISRTMAADGCHWRVAIAALWSDVTVDLNASSTPCYLYKYGQVI